MDLYALPWKSPVAAAATANIALSGLQTLDGVALSAGMRALAWKQTAPASNGVYVVAVGSWTRSADMDSPAELRGAVFVVEDGLTLADHRFSQTADAITLGTTALTFIDIGDGGIAYETLLNKDMTASATSADFDQACPIAITATPAGDGYVEVVVNGAAQNLGDAVRTRDCYFSGDGGSTARAITAINAGDVLYWVGSVAGFQLQVSDSISFNYSTG
jgi:hypothetical protein